MIRRGNAIGWVKIFVANVWCYNSDLTTAPQNIGGPTCSLSPSPSSPYGLASLFSLSFFFLCTFRITLTQAESLPLFLSWPWMWIHLRKISAFCLIIRYFLINPLYLFVFLLIHWFLLLSNYRWVLAVVYVYVIHEHCLVFVIKDIVSDHHFVIVFLPGVTV